MMRGSFSHDRKKKKYNKPEFLETSFSCQSRVNVNKPFGGRFGAALRLLIIVDGVKVSQNHLFSGQRFEESRKKRNRTNWFERGSNARVVTR